MNRSIDVCLSPDLMHLYPVQGQTIVVVDILRATSCMTTAFAHDIGSITPFAHLNECLALKEKGYLTAGERDGKKVEGFDLGNSPFEYMDPLLRGKNLAFTTTNGTQAVAEYVAKVTTNVLIVCSGWKGKVNLEDTVFAGALVERLTDKFEFACDAPIMALRLYKDARGNMKDFLKDSSHIKRLKRLNIEKDIDFCLSEDHYMVVPVLRDNRLISATL